MTLTTNQDGLLTLEGLVVANQEEVKKWLLHLHNFSTEALGVYESFRLYFIGPTFELPDDQFEAIEIFRGRKVRILRKPVSDVGENDICVPLKPVREFKVKICNCEGEKNEGLGESSELQEVVDELERELAKLEEKPMFFSGHLKGYKACISDLKIIIKTRKP